MATDIIFNTEIKKGTTGKKGDAGVNFEVPTGGIIAFDGETIPEGYEETSAPADTGILITKNIIQNGTYTAISDGADGYSQVIVDVPSIQAGGDIENGYNLNLPFTSMANPYLQSGMSYNISNNKINLNWQTASANVGASLNGFVDLNISNNGFSKIKYDIDFGQNYDNYYGSGSSGTRPFIIGVTDEIRTAYVYANVTNASNYFKRYIAFYGSEYGNNKVGELDISNLTGVNYLLIVFTGWNATINKLELV